LVGLGNLIELARTHYFFDTPENAIFFPNDNYNYIYKDIFNTFLTGYFQHAGLPRDKEAVATFYENNIKHINNVPYIAHYRNQSIETFLKRRFIDRLLLIKKNKIHCFSSCQNYYSGKHMYEQLINNTCSENLIENEIILDKSTKSQLTPKFIKSNSKTIWKELNTKLEKYGSGNFNNFQKYKETCLTKYGTENYDELDNKLFLEKMTKEEIEKTEDYKLKQEKIKQEKKRRSDMASQRKLKKQQILKNKISVKVEDDPFYCIGRYDG
jgi:hypothetical protein